MSILSIRQMVGANGIKSGSMKRTFHRNDFALAYKGFFEKNILQEEVYALVDLVKRRLESAYLNRDDVATISGSVAPHLIRMRYPVVVDVEAAPTSYAECSIRDLGEDRPYLESVRAVGLRDRPC